MNEPNKQQCFGCIHWRGCGCPFETKGKCAVKATPMSDQCVRHLEAHGAIREHEGSKTQE